MDTFTRSLSLLILATSLSACEVSVTARKDNQSSAKTAQPAPEPDPVPTPDKPKDEATTTPTVPTVPVELPKPWAAFYDAPVSLTAFTTPQVSVRATDLERISIVYDASNFYTRTVYFEYLDHSESGCFDGVYDKDYADTKDVRISCNAGRVSHQLSDWRWDAITASVNVCTISATTGQVNGCKRISVEYTGGQ